jgi:2-polyprenyl-3-methyl-5-hydroxy-6-metoxy-1,4-benzoquinol methylase
MKNTGEIEKDFLAKRDTYFQENYVKETKTNYLRRYRNELIRREIEELSTVRTVLDVGCGPAILYPELLERCETYHAMDLVESNLEKIKSQHNADKIKTIQSDLDHFVPEEGAYDVIISSGSIEYANDFESIIKVLVKALKPNGTLIISFPNQNSPYRIWGELVYRNVRNLFRKEKAPDYKRALFSEEFVRRQFVLNGSENKITVRYFGLKILLQPLDAVFVDVDYKILNYFNSRPDSNLSNLSQEFLVVYQQ